ncbi:hyalin-like [Diadema setosum]|uniref:hyalin-like n=1 Tax=Diadema setosum TaxID=31175 RepID=UPI003B3BA994
MTSLSNPFESLDSIAPVFTFCPADIFRSVLATSGATGATVTWQQPTATDNSGIAPTISAPNFPSGSFFVTGTIITIVYTATDAYGNQQQCTFAVTVTLVDDIPPALTCPSDITLTVGPSAGTLVPVSWDQATATDDSGIATLLSSPPSGSNFAAGGQPTTVIYTATDNNGNQGTCSFTVQVLVDSIAPVFTFCPTNIQINVGPLVAGQIATWQQPTATDNSGIAPTISAPNFPSGSFFATGSSTTIMYTATDAYGNSQQCTFTVTVTMVDTTMPTVDCPADTAVGIELGLTSTIVFFPAPTATDDSNEVSIASQSHSPGDTFPVGETPVTYIFQDPSGNQATCVFNVIVFTVDTTMPTVDCPANTTVVIELGLTSTMVFFPAPTATDDSNEVSIASQSHSPGDTFPVGETPVTYIFQDPSGNQATCVFNVIVFTGRSVDNGTVFDGDESCQCKNGGSCSHVGGGVSCLCREGFNGILCEEEVTTHAEVPNSILSHGVGACHPNPCLHNGTCLYDDNGSPVCDCPPHWTGVKCETYVENSTELEPVQSDRVYTIFERWIMPASLAVFAVIILVLAVTVCRIIPHVSGSGKPRPDEVAFVN